MNFAMVVRCVGPLDQSTLRAALDAVQNRHPLLQVRIEETPAGPVFQSEGVPPILLQISDPLAGKFSLDPEAIHAWIEEELVQGIDWRQGPLVRCTWVRHADEVHHLLLTFHHAIGDGMSGILLLRDLFQAMQSTAQGAKPKAKKPLQTMTPAIDKRLPKLARGWRGFLLSVKTVLRLRRADRQLSPVVRQSIDAEADLGSQRTHVFMRTFDRSFTEQLRAQAKEQNTTVNTVLSAAMSLAMAEELGADESVSLLHRSAVNVRRELDPEVGEEIGLFVSLLFYRAQLTGTEDVWEIARAIKKQHQSGREQNLPLAILKLMPALYRAIRGDQISNEDFSKKWRERTKETLGISNLGVIDLPGGAGDLKIDGFCFAVSPSSVVDFASTAATFNGQLTWSFITPCRVFEKSHAEQVVDKIIARLHAAVLPNSESCSLVGSPA